MKKKDSNTETILLTFYELRAIMSGLLCQNSIQNWTFITWYSSMLYDSVQQENKWKFLAQTWFVSIGVL